MSPLMTGTNSQLDLVPNDKICHSKIAVAFNKL